MSKETVELIKDLIGATVFIVLILAVCTDVFNKPNKK
jgi:hypothetical protein